MTVSNLYHQNSWRLRKSTLLKCLSDVRHWYMTSRCRKMEKCSQDADSLSHSMGGFSSRKSRMVSFPASSYICCGFLICYTRPICVEAQMCFNVTPWCAICFMNVQGRQKRLSHFNDSCKQRKCHMQHEAYKHNINAQLSVCEIRVAQAFSAWIMCWSTLLLSARSFHNLIINIWPEETLVLMTFSF